MIAKTRPIPHGSNAVRYSADKELAEIVKVNHLPEDITPSSMWARMMLLQQQYKDNLSGHRRIKNTSLRIELSPAEEETVGWTLADWRQLADDFIREFDTVSRPRPGREDDDPHTHLANTQYVVSLHHDSKSGILHLHINANRIDMDGNTNNEYMTGKRATDAANKINQQRGWVQSMKKREWNIDEVTRACINTLKEMDSFDWDNYEARLKAKGDGFWIKRSDSGKVVGYVVKKGHSKYKSALLGHGRSLTPSRIENTWAKLHVDKSVHTQTMVPKKAQSAAKPSATVSPKVTQPIRPAAPKQATRQSVTTEPVKQQPVMVHHDIEWKGKTYPVDISEAANDVIMKECTLPADVGASKLVDVQRTALLLFANYLDAATDMSESLGGGGGTPDSGWGRKEDEDDVRWARRCAKQSFGMHVRRSCGIHF